MFFQEDRLVFSFYNSSLFPSGQYIEEAVSNQTNYQDYQLDFSPAPVSYIGSHKFGEARRITLDFYDKYL